MVGLHVDYGRMASLPEGNREETGQGNIRIRAWCQTLVRRLENEKNLQRLKKLFAELQIGSQVVCPQSEPSSLRSSRTTRHSL